MRACELGHIPHSMSAEYFNAVGDVPTAWYRDLAHVGYNVSGNRLLRRSGNDSLSNLLNGIDDRSSWRQLFDDSSGSSIKLSKADIILLQQIQAGGLPTDSLQFSWNIRANRFNLPSSTEPKRRFLPSAWEAKLVARLVRILRRKSQAPPSSSQPAPNCYDIWEVDAPDTNSGIKSVRAIKTSMPANEFSFNPPVEYTAFAGKLIAVAPPKHLRHVCSYPGFTRERFERCLDLYLCPRSTREKVQMSPDELLPTLPAPKLLKPFPETLAQRYTSAETVKHASANCSGDLLAMCTNHGSLLIWDVHTGKCTYQFHFGTALTSVHWHPRKSEFMLLTLDSRVILVSSFRAISVLDIQMSLATDVSSDSAVWSKIHADCYAVHHAVEVREVVWHKKGQYFATSFGDRGVLIHNIDHMRSQAPFSRHNAPVVSLSFHPKKPLFFVCSHQHVRMYNLKTQELERKFSKGMVHNTCMCISPSGSSLLVGDGRGRLLWFDVESEDQGKVIAALSASLQTVLCHDVYPLVTAAACNGNLSVLHMSEPPDFDSGPVVAPLSVINESQDFQDNFSVCFHPHQPWLFSQDGARSVVLYSEK